MINNVAERSEWLDYQHHSEDFLLSNDREYVELQDCEIDESVNKLGGTEKLERHSNDIYSDNNLKYLQTSEFFRDDVKEVNLGENLVETTQSFYGSHNVRINTENIEQNNVNTQEYIDFAGFNNCNNNVIYQNSEPVSRNLDSLASELFLDGHVNNASSSSYRLLKRGPTVGFVLLCETKNSLFNDFCFLNLLVLLLKKFFRK